MKSLRLTLFLTLALSLLQTAGTPARADTTISCTAVRDKANVGVHDDVSVNMTTGNSICNFSVAGATVNGSQTQDLRRSKDPQTWAGLIDVTPDAIPVIGPVNSVLRLFIVSGFSGHGFGIGPGAGQLVAEIVTGAKTSVDPSPFRFNRFKRTATDHRQF